MFEKIWYKLLTCCFFSLALFIVGCSGGGGAAPAPVVPVSKFVTGIASEGSLILGKAITLKDSLSKTSATTTDAITGAYSIDVTTGFTPPYLLTIIGTNGTYITFSATNGTANINPITTIVLALAAGSTDPNVIASTPIATISTNYSAKLDAVSAAFAEVLPTGITALNYFTGIVTAGKGMDSVFDAYAIKVDGNNGITVKTQDASATSVASIVAADVKSGAALTPVSSAKISTVALSASSPSVTTGQNITITADVKIAGVAAADGTTVNFTTDAGTLSSASASTANGKASVTITATTVGDANVSASAAKAVLKSPVKVSFTQPQVFAVTLASDVTTQVSGKNITLTATATLNGAAVPDGTTVTFVTVGGGLSAPTATTTSGKASVTITSVGPGSASVTATVNNVTSTPALALTFTAAPSTYLVTLSADLLTQNAGKNITLTATATVNGSAVPDGTTVTFATVGGALSATTATTISGVATVTISAGAAGTANVTATANNVTSTPALALTFTPPVYAVTLTSDLATQDAGKNINLTASATVNGSAVPNGTIVTFTTAGGTLSATTATTTSGKAGVTITATVAGAATVTATVGTPAVTSTPLALTFNAVAVAPTKATLKLKTTGTLATGELVGGWGVTIKLPGSGYSIVTNTGSQQINKTAFFQSGLTPATFNFAGSFNAADAIYSVPYLKLANLGDLSDPSAGTTIGEVATIVLNIAPGTATPTKSDFGLAEISIAKAIAGAPKLTAVSFDFDLILQ